MRIKLLPLAAAVYACSMGVQAEVYDARAMGRGGVGLTMGEYNQALSNPALINQFDERDEFSFAVNVGAIASDKDGMLDDVDSVQDDLDDLEECGDAYAASGGTTPACSPDALKESLADLDEKLTQIGAGGAVVIGIPNRTLPLALVARGGAEAGVRFDYDSGDNAVLDGIANGTNDQADLTSELQATAVGITEIGLNFGKTFGDGYQVGAFLKAQQIELIKYSATVEAFDEEDIVDGDNSKKHSSVNVDLGLRKTFGENGRFVYGVTIENLIPQDFDGPNGADFSLDPVPVAGIGYQSGWFKAEASADLAKRAGFDLLEDRQFARVGMEFSAGRHLHLRAGYMEDLKNNVSSLATLGLGITPWDRANIDLAAQQGEGETYGVALQIGFKI